MMVCLTETDGGFAIDGLSAKYLNETEPRRVVEHPVFSSYLLPRRDVNVSSRQHQFSVLVVNMLVFFVKLTAVSCMVAVSLFKFG